MRWHMVESVQCFFPALANLRDISRECSLSPLPTYIASCMEVEVGGQQTGLYIPFVVVESRVENFASQQTNDNVKFDNNTETCNTASYSNKQTTMSNFWQLPVYRAESLLAAPYLFAYALARLKYLFNIDLFFCLWQQQTRRSKKRDVWRCMLLCIFIIFRVAFFFEN